MIMGANKIAKKISKKALQNLHDYGIMGLPRMDRLPERGSL